MLIHVAVFDIIFIVAAVVDDKSLADFLLAGVRGFSDIGDATALGLGCLDHDGLFDVCLCLFDVGLDVLFDVLIDRCLCFFCLFVLFVHHHVVVRLWVPLLVCKTRDVLSECRVSFEGRSTDFGLVDTKT